MDYPGDPTGTSAEANWLKRVVRASRANRLLPGPDYFLRETPAGTTMLLKSGGGGFNPDLHPFQLYKTPTSELSEEDAADADHVFYSVRMGSVELRPKWVVSSPFSLAGWIKNPTDYGTYAEQRYPGIVGRDDVWPVCPKGKLGYEGTYFTLDPAPEVVADINYGAYYSFWLEIDDSTPGDFPTVEIKCQKLSLYAIPGPSVTTAFPDATATKEIIPIALLQLIPCLSLSPGTLIPLNEGAGNLGSTGADTVSQHGLIRQFLRDNLVNRWDRDAIRNQGNFDNTEGRVYYPNDIVFYDGGDDGSSSTNYGWWKFNALSQNIGTETSPADLAAAEYFINPTPPP